MMMTKMRRRKKKRTKKNRETTDVLFHAATKRGVSICIYIWKVVIARKWMIKSTKTTILVFLGTFHIISIHGSIGSYMFLLFNQNKIK